MSFQNQIFNTVKGYGYLIKLYDKKGKGPIANPDLAAYMNAVDNSDSKESLMIRFPDLEKNDEYSKLTIYKSDIENPKFDKLLATLKQLALNAGYTVTYRIFGKSIKPKDMGYAPKADIEAIEADITESKSLDIIPGSKLSLEDQKLLYWFIEGYTRPNGPNSKQDKREKIYLRVKDEYVEYNDPRFGASHGFSKSWRIVGNEDQLLGMAYNKQSKENQSVNESMPASIIKIKQKLANMSDKELGDYLKSKSEDQILKLQKNHVLKNDRYLNVWKKANDGLNESKYETYGSTRSSYQEMPKSKSRVIIRHSKVVDESKVGARSRSVKTLMVETHTGERRIIPSKSLRGARALSNYVNNGGNIYDETANRIVQLSDDVKGIKKLKKTYPILEGDEDNAKIHQAIEEVISGLITILDRLNSNKINDYLPILTISQPNMTFSETFYKQKLGEDHDVGSLARGSIICSRIKKVR